MRDDAGGLVSLPAEWTDAVPEDPGRYRALEQAGLLHPAPAAVVSEPFRSHPEFFAAFDKVQVKYEMLRAHVVDGQSATAAASSHGYSRASFYLVQAAFERSGMVGLLDERPGRRGPVNLAGGDGVPGGTPDGAAGRVGGRAGLRAGGGIGGEASPAHGREGAGGSRVSERFCQSRSRRRRTTSGCERSCSRAQSWARCWQHDGLSAAASSRVDLIACGRARLPGLDDRRAAGGVVRRGGSARGVPV